MSLLLFTPGVIIGALLLGLVALELIARQVRKRRQSRFIWTPHQRVHLSLDPGAFPGCASEIHSYCNADGEHGHEVPNNAFRVLVAGGSAAEGYFLDQDDNWPARLQELLNGERHAGALGAGVAHVGNVARSLVPCEAIHSMLEGVFPRYEKIDLILFMVGASDVVYWLENGTPDVIVDGRIPIEQLFAVTPAGAGRWALRGMAAHLVRSLSRREERRTDVGKRLVRLRKLRSEARVMLDEVPDVTPLHDYFDRHFRVMLESAKRKAKRVIVVRQPWFDVEPGDVARANMWNFARGRPGAEGVDTYFSHAVMRRLLAGIDERAVKHAEELGIEHFDLRSRLDSTLENYYDFLHFTPRGAERIAEELAGTITGEAAAT